VANWRGFLGARQAATRIRDTLKATNSLARATELPMPSHSLSVNNLATGPLSGRPTVIGVAFSLEAGDGMGIIGPSGSGKSSLARALVGVWPVLQGDVRLDGAEIGHYGQERIGRAIGYLPQSVELFDGTVAENIARFRPDATTEQIIAAAKAANVHELISALPDGYDTKMGERGAVLSAGQRQRIGLARALFGDPFLVVLDEPNSNLDPDGDQSLTESLTKARKRGAIVIVVAHRPSAIVALDKLLFLRNGRQGAFGPKDEVLKRINQPAKVVDVARMGAAGHG
jgi:ABC-type protease/lipase transport system fused ATPase/permease subunit